MHRAILIAWLPWFLSLVAAAGMLWLLVRCSGARLCPAKLRRIHRCEAGSVQTLSFVLTLPLFILLLMFIVQVAELMIGIGVVHYAAFAAARAASVWIPAEVLPFEPANTFDPGTVDEDFGQSQYPRWLCNKLTFNNFAFETHWKYRKVWTAAAIACAPLSPARDLERSPQSTYIGEAVKAMYVPLSPTSANYPRLRQLIDKKLNYSARNTWIIISGLDRDSAQGPTYNPFPGHYVRQFSPATGQTVDVWIPWNAREIGWEDPISVSVFHSFALLPGPGRFLSTFLSPPDGSRDTVSPLVKPSRSERYRNDGENLRLYQVVLSAEVTLSNEGLKSVMPYAQPND